ncbi:ATP-binding protein [Kitasatospora sp. NBC_01287]|uniref:ATP-binding protein n=1 Tax=Kitasatospora sp. NBC_01287 TaxID=2903573 RepID=UPI002251D979|nr:ATP-binding protein [Kitasatospora sp. NBC_01287]MCX4745980.1 ATP-binding protein [Kitasatospora sp. NBC_01287]
MNESLRPAPYPGAPLTPRQPLTLVLHVAPTLEDAAETRRLLLDGISRWGLDLPPDRLEDLELLAGEVINNAVIHTRRAAIVTATWGGTVVRVEVADQSAELPVPCEESDPGLESGRGLNLVKALSNSWGVNVDEAASSKSVWFECGARHVFQPGPVAALPDRQLGAPDVRAPRTHRRPPRSPHRRLGRRVATAMIAAGHITVAGILGQIITQGPPHQLADHISASAPDLPSAA